MAQPAKSPKPLKSGAENDFFNATEDLPVNLNVLANDKGSTKVIYSLDQLDATAPSQNPIATSVLGAVITVNSDGTIQYDPISSTAIQALAGGQTATDTFVYWLEQGNSYSRATVSVTVTGTNDAPTVTGVVAGTATEDGAAVLLNALANASDIDNGTTLSVVNVPVAGELPAGVTYNPTTKTFSLDPADAAYQSLGTDAPTTVTVNYGVSDGIVTTAASVSWIVAGTNDAPTVTGVVAGTATEDGAAVLLNALANASDIDNGTTLSVVNVPVAGDLPAGVTHNPTTKTFSLDPADAAYQSLGADAHTTVTVNYGVSDGVVTTAASVSWEIAGTHDNIVRGDPSWNFEYLFGHAGESDIFIFDAANVSTSYRFDFLYGFESGLDKVAFVNLSPDKISFGPAIDGVTAGDQFGPNDPNISDHEPFVQFYDETGTIKQLIAVAIDAIVIPSDVLVYSNDPFVPQPNLIYDNAAVAWETHHGTAGEADFFMFDATSWVAPELIIGFETGVDKIVLFGHDRSDYYVADTGVPGDMTNYAPDGIYHFAIAENDPSLADGLVGAELLGANMSFGTIFLTDVPDLTNSDLIVAEINPFLF